MKIPKEIRVIEVNNIELSDKDLIYVKNCEDFLWLTSNTGTIFKSMGYHYILSNDVAYIYKEKG